MVIKEPPDERPPVSKEISSPLFDTKGPTDLNASVEGPWWLTETPKLRVKAKRPDGIFSSGRVKLVHLCMKRFHWRHVDKRPDPSGPEAIVGKLVHGVYQDAGARRLAGNRRGIPSVASVEELRALLEFQPAQLASEEEDGADSIVPTLIEDARTILVATGPIDFRHVHAVELSWTLALAASLVVGGKIDRIDLEGLPEPTVVTVYDYKTGEELEQEELWHDPQVGLYSAWAHRQWPKARVRFVLWNVRHQSKQTVWWTPALDSFALSYAKAAHGLASVGMDTASAGEHCRNCPYRDGDAKWPACDAYMKELERSKFTTETVGGLARHDLPKLLRIYRGSAVAKDLHETLKGAARELILKKLGSQRSYQHGDLKAYTSSERADEFEDPINMLRKLAEATSVKHDDLMRDVLRVHGRELERWVAALPEDKLAAAKAILDQHRTLGSFRKLTVRRIGSMF